MAFQSLVMAAIFAVAAVGQDVPPADQVASLASQLVDDDPLKSESAALELARLGARAKAAAPQLVKALADNRVTRRLPFGIPAPQPIVADAAARALAAIGKPAAPLLASQAKRGEKLVRQRALRVLAQIGERAGGDATLIQDLRSLASQDVDLEIRLDAMQAAASLGGSQPVTIRFLGDALSDRSPELRGLAVSLLGNLGAHAASETGRLTPLLRDMSQRAYAFAPDAVGLRAVRHDVAEALGKIGPSARSAAEALQAMAKSDPSDEIRAAAALAVYRIEKQDAKKRTAAVQMLINQMSAADTEYGIEAAVAALGEVGGDAEPALPALANLLKHRNSALRLETVETIAAIRSKDSPGFLARALADDEHHIRIAAIEALGQLGPLAKTMLDQLSRLSEDKDRWIREAAQEAMQKIQTPEHHSATPMQ